MIGECVAQVAAAAPQVTSLDLYALDDQNEILVCSNLDERGEPLFPRLLNLEIHFHNSFWFDHLSPALDILIQRRCLPKGHPQSTMDDRILRPLETLKVAFPLGIADKDHHIAKGLSFKQVERIVQYSQQFRLPNFHSGSEAEHQHDVDFRIIIHFVMPSLL